MYKEELLFVWWGGGGGGHDGGGRATRMYSKKKAVLETGKLVMNTRGKLAEASSPGSLSGLTKRCGGGPRPQAFLATFHHISPCCLQGACSPSLSINHKHFLATEKLQMQLAGSS